MALLNVSTGERVRIFKDHWGKVVSVSFSPDGCFALSADDHTLRLWEVSTGKSLCDFGSAALGVNDGVDLLVLSSEGDEDGERHTGTVASVAFSPDGRLALSGSWDNTLRLWEVSTSEHVRVFKGHRGGVRSVAFGPDGRLALSGGEDKTVRLWEVPTGKCLRAFEGHTGAVGSVAFSPDGRFALSGGDDNTLRLWELDWEFDPKELADWDEGARHFLTTFLTIYASHAEDLAHRGKPAWTEDDFRRLLDKLGCAGFGWLRPEGVRRELETMAQKVKGPDSPTAGETTWLAQMPPVGPDALRQVEGETTWQAQLAQMHQRLHQMAQRKPRGWLRWLFGR